jgi:hypothetical protein
MIASSEKGRFTNGAINAMGIGIRTVDSAKQIDVVATAGDY